MRLNALDAFRGMTVALMILVDMAGAAERFYPALDHAAWTGWTPTDLVFPYFLFAVGMALSLGDKRPRILKRTLVLFALGVLGNRLMVESWGEMRLMGILQRIALCYAAAALMARYLSLRAQVAVCALILLGYWAALTLIPVPGAGPGVLTREGSFASYVDRVFISRRHLYRQDGWDGAGDPEGLLSTLPAVVSTMFGYFAGVWLRGRRPSTEVTLRLAAAGALLYVLGAWWGLSFPVIKKIWTSSFAVLMGGCSLLSFAVLYEISEVRGLRRWLMPLERFGRNALTAFLGSLMMLGLLEKFHAGGPDGPNLLRWLSGRLFESWLGPYNGSAAFAAAAVAFWWLVVSALDKRGWRVRA